jgi:hypothetical protein
MVKPKKLTHISHKFSTLRYFLKKVLNSILGVLVKHINKKILSWNLCIQYIENVKSCLYQH